jgi:hypothetical protein
MKIKIELFVKNKDSGIIISTAYRAYLVVFINYAGIVKSLSLTGKYKRGR